MTADLDLIASSKAELAVESVAIDCKGEEVILETLVTDMGLQDAGNVKVQFFNGPPSSDSLLGEQIIQLLSGESVASSIDCVLPDGLYTFHIVLDPDDLISESCEYNNELSVKYLLDRTPPEAEIFFDPTIEDLAVRGVDNLDLSVDIPVTEKVIKNRTVRTYVLTDDAENTTKLQLEVKHHKHEIKAEIIDM
jgi:subtilase family serine protease